MKKLDDNKVYSVFVIILASAAMLMAVLTMLKVQFTNDTWYTVLEYCILLFFIVDYIVRLVQAKGKWLFIRKNMFDVIAIISLHPSLTFFRIPRILRLTHFYHLFQETIFYTWYMDIKKKLDSFLETNGLVHVLYINFFCVIIGSVLVFLFESRATFPTFGDVVWWALVTVTTVGYGDYVPKTLLGRSVAVLLMLVGIGLISMITGTIATYFTAMKKKGVKEELNELRKMTSNMNERQLLAVTEYAKRLQDGKIDLDRLDRIKKEQEEAENADTKATAPTEPSPAQ